MDDSFLPVLKLNNNHHSEYLARGAQHRRSSSVNDQSALQTIEDLVEPKLAFGRIKISSLKKYLNAAARPAFWRSIARGVMPAVEHFDALNMISPHTVIDIGANKGQFSLIARHLFPSAQIFAFEPLVKERRYYCSVVTDPVRISAVALGAEAGKRTFFITSRADSSSLLTPGKSQEAAYGVNLASTESVDVKRLDDVISPGDLKGETLLKLDVQGAELSVLQGGKSLLPHIHAVYCEVSFVELYEDQPTAGAVVSFLDQHGFALRGVFNLSLTGRFGPTQADLLFLRRPRDFVL